MKATKKQGYQLVCSAFHAFRLGGERTGGENFFLCFNTTLGIFHFNLLKL